MSRDLRTIAAATTLLAVGLAGCKGVPPPLPPVPPGSGSLLLPPGPVPTAPEDQPVVDRVVAVVNEEVILMSELQEALVLYLRETREAMPATEPERDRLLQKVLARMVDHRLQIQEARRDKVEVSDDEIGTVMDDFVKRNGGDRPRIEEQLRAQGLNWELIRRDMRESLLAQKVRARRIGRRSTVTEAEVDRYLEENRVKFETELKYHPRHLAVLAQPPSSPAAWERAKAEIDGIVARLRDGADFAEVARLSSQDGAASTADDLGWLARGELAPMFEEPILRLGKGEVTEPIKSDNGYHIFRLEDREVLTSEMLGQLRQQVRDILLQKKGQERLEEWLQGLRQRALIAERL
jgi:peptidyl-prolyl cis-trans isomerase SurA